MKRLQNRSDVTLDEATIPAQTRVSGQKSWRQVFNDLHNEGENVRICIAELADNFPENLKDIDFLSEAENALRCEHDYHMSVDYDAEEMSKIRQLHDRFRKLEEEMWETIISQDAVKNETIISREPMPKYERKMLEYEAADWIDNFEAPYRRAEKWLEETHNSEIASILRTLNDAAITVIYKEVLKLRKEASHE